MRVRALGLALACVLGGLACGCSDAPVLEPPVCAYGAIDGAVFSALGFTRADASGAAPGFNLDGRVSDGSDSATCGKQDFVDPEGRPGIDNQLASLVPDIEKTFGDAPDGLIQGAINNGELVILMQMEGVDDLADDGCVNLSVVVGEKRPPSLGTDGVIEAYQTLHPDPDAIVNEVKAGRIEDGVMTAGPFDVAIPLAIFDVAFIIHVHHAFIRFSIDEEGKMKGYLGGGIVPEEIVEGVKQGAGLEDVIPALGVVMRAASDLEQDEDGKCRQLSATLAFEAVPAFIRP